MKTIDGYKFPETPAEAADWTPDVRVVALDRTVLAVARTRVEGAWGAYIAAVPGLNHDDEFDAVLREGGKLHEPIAMAIFPTFAAIPWAR